MFGENLDLLLTALQRRTPKTPGLRVPGNIDLNRRPVVHNSDGSISTVRSVSFGTNKGEVLVPTVVNGRVVSNQEALRHYQQTGKHLGIFDSPTSANRYAVQLHREQAAWYSNPRRHNLT
jgi:hypothetical protein